jgi:hypothetical protein
MELLAIPLMDMERVFLGATFDTFCEVLQSLQDLAAHQIHVYPPQDNFRMRIAYLLHQRLIPSPRIATGPYAASVRNEK